MKKFLTVLLALSVVFTYSFSAVGSVFAATDEDDFKTAVSTYKGSLSYDGNDYLNAEPDSMSSNWVGYISKKVLEAAIDNWADSVDLNTNTYTEDNGAGAPVLTAAAKAAMFKAIGSDVNQNQYASNLSDWNALVATVDFTAYNDTGKASLQTAIEAGEDAIADVKVNTLSGVKAIAAQITALKAAIKANEDNLLAESDKNLTETVAALEKTLDDASYDYYMYAKEWFEKNSVTSANEVAAKASFDTDYNTLVAYFESCIERYEDEVKAEETPLVEATRLGEVINYYFVVNESLNSPVEGYFQNAIGNLAQKDVWNAYYEKAADTAKAALKADGTKMYYDADVDKLLADTKDAVLDDLWSAFDPGTFGTTAADIWSDGLEALQEVAYDLQGYREKAIAKFTEDNGTSKYALTNWTGDRADKVEALQDEYAEKVLQATTVEEIDALVEEAQDKIDAIMTKADVNSVAGKVALRIKAAGYLDTVTVSTDGKGEVTAVTDTDGFAAYFDVVVGKEPTYKAAIKTAALKAAAQVFVDAVLAEENDSITYKQIDEIIAANKDAAYETLKNVKTTAALKEEAAAVTALIKALPSTITIADKAQVLDAQAAMDAYMENAGAAQTDVSKYATLKTALTTIINAEAREVTKLIRALPATVTVENADQIAAARTAYDAWDEAYGDYVDSDYVNTVNAPSEAKLNTAEAALENAKLAYAAKLIDALTSASTEAEIEAAQAAFNAMDTEHKLMLNDQLYNKLMNAVKSLTAKKIASVESLKIVTSTKLYTKSNKIRVNWKVKDGDASAITGYQVYKSTKAQTGYKFMGKTTKNYMDNKKNLKKGQRYYYKVRAYIDVDGERYYSDWSNKGNRIYK